MTSKETALSRCFVFCVSLHFFSLYTNFTLSAEHTGIWSRPSPCLLVLVERSFIFSATLCHYTSLATILAAHRSHPWLSARLIVTVRQSRVFLRVEHVSDLEEKS